MGKELKNVFSIKQQNQEIKRQLDYIQAKGIRQMLNFLLLFFLLLFLIKCGVKEEEYKTEVKQKENKVIHSTNNKDSILDFIDSLVHTKELINAPCSGCGYHSNSQKQGENFTNLLCAKENSIPLLIDRIDDSSQTTAFFLKPYKRSPFVVGQICLILIDLKIGNCPFWTLHKYKTHSPTYGYTDVGIHFDYFYLFAKNTKYKYRQLKKLKKLYKIWYEGITLIPQKLVSSENGSSLNPCPYIFLNRNNSKKFPTEHSIMEWWEKN